MNISFCCADTKAEPWLEGLRAALPGAQVEVWQPGAPQADHAVVWAPGSMRCSSFVCHRV